jgi:predicted dehydrogenase/FAD/FMN-containing dehydrogenase
LSEAEIQARRAERNRQRAEKKARREKTRQENQLRHKTDKELLGDQGLPCLRLGLIGCSWFALRAHIPTLQKISKNAKKLGFSVRLEAICSRTAESMARCQELVGRPIKQYLDMHALLADPEVDAVDIVLPIHLMPMGVEAAIKAGKHILSEKPIAPTFDAAKQLMAMHVHACTTSPKAWCVLENWGLKPATRCIFDHLQQGTIGKPLSFYFVKHETLSAEIDQSWRGQGLFKGGALVDIGVHFVRALRVLFGEVTKVTNATKATKQSAVCPEARSALATSAPATARVTLEFDSGIHGVFCMSSALASTSGTSTGSVHDLQQPQSTLTIVGERGRLSWDLNNTIHVTHHPESLSRGKAQLRTDAPLVKFPTDNWIVGGCLETMTNALSHVASMAGMRLKHTSPNLARCCCTAQDALRDLAVVEAIMLAAAAPLSSSQSPQAATVPGYVPAPTSPLLCPRTPVHDATRSRQYHPQHMVLAFSSAEVMHTIQFAAKQRRSARSGAVGGAVGGAMGGVVGGAVVQASSASRDSFNCDSSNESRNGEHGGGEGSSGGHGGEGSWRNTNENGQCMRVRAIGFNHSWSPYSETNDICIDMSPMNRILRIDRATKRVVVQAGCMLNELVHALAQATLCLPSLPCLLEQTVAGGVCTGTHGMSAGFGTLSDSVTAVTMVTAAGEVVRVSETGAENRSRDPMDSGNNGDGGSAGDSGSNDGNNDGGDLLRAARHSLGLLGIITEVELQCEEMYHVQKHTFEMPLEQMVQEYAQLVQSHTHIWIKWAIGHPLCAVCTLDKVTEKGDSELVADEAMADEAQEEDARDRVERTAQVARGAKAGQAGAEIVRYCARSASSSYLSLWFPFDPPAVPGHVPGHSEATKSSPERAADQAADQATKGGHATEGEHATEGTWLSMEYSVSIDKLPEAVRTICSLGAEPSHSYHGRIVEIKFVAHSEKTLIGVNNASDVACFNLWWEAVPSEKDRLLQEFETSMLAMGGVPHLGKMHSSSAATAAAFPHVARFRQQVLAQDPGGMFSSSACGIFR